MTALDVLLPDSQRRVRAAEHGPADVTANAHVAADEFRLLAHLHAAGLSVPKPVAYDGAVTGAASAIVLERLAGASTPAPADRRGRTADGRVPGASPRPRRRPRLFARRRRPR
ncbi:MAG: lipopolysaccharide kinase InaA family protein [Caldilineaceae bacterium]